MTARKLLKMVYSNPHGKWGFERMTVSAMNVSDWGLTLFNNSIYLLRVKQTVYPAAWHGRDSCTKKICHWVYGTGEVLVHFRNFRIYELIWVPLYHRNNVRDNFSMVTEASKSKYYTKALANIVRDEKYLLEVFHFAVNVYKTKWKSVSGVQTWNYFFHKILRHNPRFFDFQETSKIMSKVCECTHITASTSLCFFL